MVQRLEEVKTSTRCIIFCSETFRFFFIEIVERPYENINPEQAFPDCARQLLSNFRRLEQLFAVLATSSKFCLIT